jgi:enoyl-CoA hydratase/carnithine racemase
MALETLAMLVDGPEWREGMSAFLEKREPRFRT